MIPELQNIASISGRGNHVLALDTEGTVFAWGCPEQCQLGRRVEESDKPSSLTPQVAAPFKARAIAAGMFHSFAIGRDGKVYAWGLNNYGQTGIGKGAGDDKAVVEEPTEVTGLQDYDIRCIQGGQQHSIACTESGAVLVWGRCQDGQIGVELSTLPKEDVVFNDAEKPVIVKKPTLVPGTSYGHLSGIPLTQDRYPGNHGGCWH